jgi:hypothetical protein
MNMPPVGQEYEVEYRSISFTQLIMQRMAILLSLSRSTVITEKEMYTKLIEHEYEENAGLRKI